ncbi:PQQ-binding-like beta-propeller repeat protein [Stieleria sp. TO1_6]|uniref:outer membrane protein assembly factor BamB family protein n=1 Tax=Stieleria tagensis TaxID=2956795 RepID=UPI00209B5BC4|nr:PQQ-binding-like beta-propeller repeat protein [Stieleria tagensis]MCO8120971.1 PQQ-binding-like beta-propeller repeat protein [Stieleria tagensis]
MTDSPADNIDPQSPDKQAADKQSPYQPQQTEPAAGSRPPSMRSAWVALGLATAVIAIAQFVYAPRFDYQNAHLISLVSVCIATLYLLFCLHRRVRWGGHPWRVPIVALVAGLLLMIGFRFDGFSGEMFPQFQWRFQTAPQHKLKSIVGEAPLADTNSESGSTAADSSIAVPGGGDSPQFLGPNRNAVYPDRDFSIPGNDSDLEVVWDQGIGAGWSSFAVQDGYAITLEQRDDQECLTCYRLADGELLWIQRHPGLHTNTLGGTGPRSTPTLVDGKVYASTATGWIWCVEQSSGEIVWTVDLLALAGWNQSEFEAAAPWGYAGSPLIVDQLCVLPMGGPVGQPSSASLVALNKDTGETVWTSGDDQLSYASPILTTLGGQPQIVSVNEKTVSGHAIADGTQLWSFDWPGSTNTGANCSSAISVSGDRLLVGKGYGGGSALVEVSDRDGQWTTQDVWRSNRILKTKFNHACIKNEVAFGISNGALQAVDLNDQSVFWTQPRQSRAAQGQVILAGDVLIVQDEQGDVVFVPAITEDYQEALRLPALDSKTWNIPTLAGRFLLVRNDRQAICYRLPAK